MTPTLLIDLDETLLGSDMGNFLPAYLEAVGRHFDSFAPPEAVLPALLSATRRMIENNRPDRSLKQVFDNTFYPALNLQEANLRESVAAFYQEVFPGLRQLTQPFSESARVVRAAAERGYIIAIATNPLFPRAAILQRLEWSGISPQEPAIHLITSYEDFHFAKPNPTYYAEVLARLGWPEGPVVMVGDEYENDILPARRLGLAAFWVGGAADLPENGTIPPSARGKLADLIPWLDATDPEDLVPDYDRPVAMEAILRSTPAALAGLTAGLPEADWTLRPDPKEWSLAEILCHLRDVEEEVHLPRLRKLIEEPNPFLPGMDTDPWAEERLYICQNGPEALQAFIDCRMELLALIESLSPEDWWKPARHAIFGPTHLSELVNIHAGHDQLHVRQAGQVLETIRSLAERE